MVGNSHIHLSVISSLVIGNVVACIFIGSNIESISCVKGDVLVFRGMVDTVLSDEL